MVVRGSQIGWRMYLIHVGTKLLVGSLRRRTGAANVPEAVREIPAFRLGLLTDLSNPKAVFTAGVGWSNREVL